MIRENEGPPQSGLRQNGRPVRLAILASHPIQYHAPWFRYLATRFHLEVLYAHKQNARGQGAAGFDVAFDWDVPLLDGYRHHWLKNVSRKPGLQSFRGCDTPELYELIRPQNYDALLVLGWNRKSFVQGIRAAWRHGVPVLMRGDSQLGTGRSRLKRALKYFPYRWFLPRIDAHLYVGKRNREYLRHYGVPEHQLFFSPHFVDNDFFASRAREARTSGRAAAIRAKFNIPADAFVALFVGKFLAKKRVNDFIAASLRAARKRNDFHALLVGDGPLRPNVEEMARGNPQIHFAGFRNQSEMPDAYAAANVLVLPSDAEETWGLVVNEAMACGVPAIVSDAVGCAPDLIEFDATGAVFPVGDVNALFRHLVKFSGADVAALQQKSAECSIMRATEGLEQAIVQLTGHTAKS